MTRVGSLRVKGKELIHHDHEDARRPLCGKSQGQIITRSLENHHPCFGLAVGSKTQSSALSPQHSVLRPFPLLSPQHSYRSPFFLNSVLSTQHSALVLTSPTNQTGQVKPAFSKMHGAASPSHDLQWDISPPPGRSPQPGPGR